MNILSNVILKKGTFSYEQLDSFPENPINGMTCFVNKVLYIYTTLNGESLWFPLSQKYDSFIFEKEEASEIWNIEHKLNTKDIIYTIYDSENNSIISNIEFIDLNNIRVILSEATSGKIIIFAASYTINKASNGTNIPDNSNEPENPSEPPIQTKSISPILSGFTSFDELTTTQITITNYNALNTYNTTIFDETGTIQQNGWTITYNADKINITSPEVTGNTSFIVKVTSTELSKTISDIAQHTFTVNDLSESTTWELQFNLGNAISRISASTILGWNSQTYTFTLEDMYGQTYNNDNPKVELMFCGWVGNEKTPTEMPKTVLKDLGVDSRIAQNGSLEISWDYDFTTNEILFKTGSPSTKIYKLVKNS